MSLETRGLESTFENVGVGKDVTQFTDSFDHNCLRSIAKDDDYKEYLFQAKFMDPSKHTFDESMRWSLPERAWQKYDETIHANYEKNIRITADFLAAGLRYDLGPRPLGITELLWYNRSDSGGAETSMSGQESGRTSRQEYKRSRMDIPIIFEDFQVERRALESSYLEGRPIDTSLAAQCSKNNTLKIEDIIVNGTDILGSDQRIYGLLDFPGRNQITDGGFDFSTDTILATDGTNILREFKRMIKALEEDNVFGPYIFYVNNIDFMKFDDDYRENYAKSIYARLYENSNIQAIRPTSSIPSNTIVALKLDQTVLDLPYGFGPTMLQWGTLNPFVKKYRIMSMIFPRFKTDYDGRCGLLTWKMGPKS